MSLPLDVEAFAMALNSDRGVIPTPSAEGFVRKTDDPKVIEFSPPSLGSSCTTWIRLPLDMIEKVQPLGKRSCKDHHHDYVVLHFKQPRNTEAAIFAELLYHARNAFVNNLSDVAPAAGPTWKTCYYDRGTGQYAGSSLHYDQDAATRFCINWHQLHGGQCHVRPINEECPR
jgi:hypothetical protein